MHFLKVGDHIVNAEHIEAIGPFMSGSADAEPVPSILFTSGRTIPVGGRAEDIKLVFACDRQYGPTEYDVAESAAWIRAPKRRNEHGDLVLIDDRSPASDR